MAEIKYYECQTFCENNQRVSAHIPVPYWPCTAKDEIIGHGEANYWNRRNWRALMKYIDDARYNHTDQIITKFRFTDSQYYDEEFLTAEAFNAVAKGLNSGGEVSSSGTASIAVKKDDVIYGSYLTQLIQEARELKFQDHQCYNGDDPKPVYCSDCCDCKESSGSNS